jgi:Protein of unknown function (DUF3168)
VRTALRRAIYGKLSGDTTLTNLLGAAPDGYTKAIYHGQAPERVAYPLVIFDRQSGVPAETFGDPQALENEIWLVKAIDHGATADTAEAIADRIAGLLNDAALSVSGGSILYLRRQSDVDYAEIVDGELFRHCGSLFRLVADI